MDQTDPWRGLPYYPISQFYIERFGERVRKISVTTAQTCPNREGLKGMQTCNFCDEWGSSAYPENQKDSVADRGGALGLGAPGSSEDDVRTHSLPVRNSG